MIQGVALSVLLTVLVWICFGAAGVGVFLIQSVIAILLLEVVNYIEHYGLARKELSDSEDYEPGMLTVCGVATLVDVSTSSPIIQLT